MIEVAENCGDVVGPGRPCIEGLDPADDFGSPEGVDRCVRVRFGALQQMVRESQPLFLRKKEGILFEGASVPLEMTMCMSQLMGPDLIRLAESYDHVASFGFIWAALALYTADNLWAQRKK